MNEWKPFLGRITLFPIPAMPISSPPPPALDLYRQIWGGEPDSFQKQANVLAPTVAQGRRGELIVNSTNQPGRIDFSLSAAITQASLGTVALIDHPSELRDELRRIINFLDGSSLLNNISRVAFSLQFLSVKATYAEANKAVTEVIPDRYGVTITEEESFIFQINQPYRHSEFQDIKMNFVTKWSVEQFHILMFSMPPGGVPAQQGTTFLQPKMIIAASVLFDANNTPLIPERALTCKEQSALLEEALDLSVRKQQESDLNIDWGILRC